MDEPPRKRRKTASPAANARESSPLKKPPRRPSFASPTKASLARFNPTLLPPRPTSSHSETTRPDSRSGILDRRRQSRASISGETGEDAIQSQIARDEDQAGTGANPRSTNERLSVTPRRPRRFGSRARSSIPPEAVQENDAELPTSSTGAQQESPRRGVLFSSSPLKRPPGLKGASKAPPPDMKRKRVQTRRTPPVIEKNTEAQQDQEESRKKTKAPPDPELEQKKREKQKLLQELQTLEGDISQSVRMIDEFQHLPATHNLSPSERDNLISFINRIAGSEDAPEKHEAPAVSSLLCSFLPFSAFAVPQPQTKAPPEAPIPSHRPVELEDPLPYLRMFTDFKFDSTVSLAHPTDTNNPTSIRHHKHTIDAFGPQYLLTVKLEVTIDALKHSVVDIRISGLSVWASSEFGVFARAKAAQKDLGTICWALQSYWELSKKRAEFWHDCESAFFHLGSRHPDEDQENMIARSRGKPSSSMSRKQLLRQLGRETLVLRDRHVQLVIRWDISFDWTGEAESRVGVTPAFPRVWSEADDKNNLKKIPETFNSLLERQGVFGATKSMVALLFGEQQG